MHFNFKSECLTKFDEEIYQLFMDAFECLPIAALVDDRILAIHGGITPTMLTEGLEPINQIDRFVDVSEDQTLVDLLWSDPSDGKKNAVNIGFTKNLKRKCSQIYGSQAVNQFLEDNSLICIVRAHEVQMDGYKFHTWNGAAELPPVITIFGAPNYCDIY